MENNYEERCYSIITDDDCNNLGEALGLTEKRQEELMQSVIDYLKTHKSFTLSEVIKITLREARNDQEVTYALLSLGYNLGIDANPERLRDETLSGFMC